MNQMVITVVTDDEAAVLSFLNQNYNRAFDFDTIEEEVDLTDPESDLNQTLLNLQENEFVVGKETNRSEKKMLYNITPEGSLCMAVRNRSQPATHDL